MLITLVEANKDASLMALAAYAYCVRTKALGVMLAPPPPSPTPRSPLPFPSYPHSNLCSYKYNPRPPLREGHHTPPGCFTVYMAHKIG